jgi:hypothetical protein
MSAESVRKNLVRVRLLSVQAVALELRTHTYFFALRSFALIFAHSALELRTTFALRTIPALTSERYTTGPHSTPAPPYYH